MSEDHNANRSPIFPTTPGATVRALRNFEMPRRCPLTLEPMVTGDWVAECDSCHAVHRLVAWRENEGCSTLACRRAPNARRDHPDQVMRVDAFGSAVKASPIAENWPSDRIVIRFESSGPKANPIMPPAPVRSPLMPPPMPPSRPPPPPMLLGTGRPAAVPDAPFPPPGVASHVRPPAKLGIRREARSDESARRCPYSMEYFKSDTPVVECRSCGQVLIASAWDENGGCTTYGCAGAPDFRKDQL